LMYVYEVWRRELLKIENLERQEKE
jgi:hypothetical protein